MAAIDYSAFRSMADDMIGDAGTTMSLVRMGASTGPAYDPTFEDDVSFSFIGVRATIKRRLDVGSDEFIIAAAGSLVDDDGGAVEPTDVDRVIAGGRTYQIVEVERVAPAGTVVVWKLKVVAT